LNLVCFPMDMDKKILGEIISGGAAKAAEADTLIVGGHSIYDHEPKYGLAVTGLIDPKNLLLNNSCRPGDALILTKALGTGLVMAALREGAASPEAAKAATDSMERLNRYAAEKIGAISRGKSEGRTPEGRIHACTDVTGFGLGVHASEMAGENYTLVIDSACLPLLPCALKFAEEGYVTGGGGRNRKFMEGRIDISSLPPPLGEIVFDPQTSGGLLIACDSEAAEELCGAIRRDDPSAAIIGKVLPRKEKAVIFE
jgi:selenide,water dikinase